MDDIRSDRPHDGTTPLHGRVPWPAPSDLDARQRALRERIVDGPRGGEAFPVIDGAGRLQGPFNLMLLAPEVGSALSELGATLRFRTTLSDRVREIAILTLAVLERASVEWCAHEPVARRAGMTDEEIGALRGLAAAPSFDEAEQVVQQAVVSLAEVGDLDDEAYGRLVAALGVEAAVELVVLIGYYRTLSLAMRVLRTPLPEGMADPFSASEHGSPA